MMKKIHIYLIIIFIILFSMMIINCSESTSQEVSNENDIVNTQATNIDKINNDNTNEDNMKVDSQDIIDGEELVEERCTQCHNLDKVYNAVYDKEGWIETVEKMIGYGANINDEEKEKVINYLYYNYGETLVQNKCTQCHGLDKIENADYDKEGWTDTVNTMISYGANLEDKEKDAVINYLVISSTE